MAFAGFPGDDTEISPADATGYSGEVRVHELTIQADGALTIGDVVTNLRAGLDLEELTWPERSTSKWARIL